MSTHQAHGRVILGALLSEDGASKDGMKVVLMSQVYLHL